MRKHFIENERTLSPFYQLHNQTRRRMAPKRNEPSEAWMSGSYSKWRSTSPHVAKRRSRSEGFDWQFDSEGSVPPDQACLDVAQAQDAPTLKAPGAMECLEDTFVPKSETGERGTVPAAIPVKAMTKPSLTGSPTYVGQIITGRNNYGSKRQWKDFDQHLVVKSIASNFNQRDPNWF